MYFDRDKHKFMAYIFVTEENEEIQGLWDHEGWEDYKERLTAEIGEIIKYKNVFLAAIKEIEKGKCTHCYFKYGDRYKECDNIKCLNRIYVEIKLNIEC